MRNLKQKYMYIYDIFQTIIILLRSVIVRYYSIQYDGCIICVVLFLQDILLILVLQIVIFPKSAKLSVSYTHVSYQIS